MAAGRIIAFCAIIPLLISCSRMEGNRYVPESLPYSAEEFCHTGILGPPEEPYNNVSVDLTSGEEHAAGRDWLFYLARESDTAGNSAGLIATFRDAIADCAALDQLTFNTDKYPGLRDVSLCVPGADISGEGPPDPIFLMRYRDSMVVTVWSADAGPDTATALPRWVSRSSIPFTDDYYAQELALWHPHPDSGYLLVLRKSCNIRSVFRIDTLVCIDLQRGGVRFTIPVAPLYCHAIGILQEDSLLVLRTYDSHSPLRYAGFDSDHRYLTALRTDGTMAWVDTLCYRRRFPTAGYTMSEPGSQILITSIRFNDNDPDNDSTQILMHDRRTGHLIRSAIYRDYVQIGYVGRNANGGMRIIGFPHRGGIIELDSTLAPSQTADLNLYDVGVITTDGRFPAKVAAGDIDNDGADEIVLRSSNQIIVIDGRDYSPVLAIDLPQDAQSVQLLRRGASWKLAIARRSHIVVFITQPTPLPTRILAHSDRIGIAFVFLLLLPIGYYLFRRIQYHRLLFRTLTTQSAAQGVVVFKRGGRVRSINSRAIELLELNRAKRKYTAGDFPHEVNEMVKRYRAGGREQNAQIILGLNQQRYLGASVTGFKGLGGVAAEVLVVGDATEIVESELRRNMLSLSLSIAHDANNPLAAIRSKFEAMVTRIRREGDAPAWVDDAERVVSESIDEARHVIRKLMYITNIAESSFGMMRLRDAVEGWMESSGRRYRRGGVCVANMIGPDLPQLRIESKHVGLLLQCACDNALEAMTEGQENAAITFDASVIDGEITLTIADNGSGMDRETLLELNRPYFTTKRTGSGLGMKIIRKVCAEHGAAMSIASGLGEGTTITIRFPRMDNDHAPVEQAASTRRNA